MWLITADVAAFGPDKKYDLWHDRAAFHFLTDPREIGSYVATVRAAVWGHTILGMFSSDGLQKCSKPPIARYKAAWLAGRFSPDFAAVQWFTDDHTTPFDAKQSFLFCTITWSGAAAF